MKVLVAMSGGVDSSVAALLLRDASHEVTGVTMKLWGGPSDTGCCSVSDVDDARRVADHIGVEHHVFNFSQEFDRYVVEPYVAAHTRAVTPNPCIECNRHLKFDTLLRRADALGFDAVATGHHARVLHGPDGHRQLARGADTAKDQSYVLYPLHGPDLDRVLFPIGELHKDEVRTIATEAGLRTAAKPDSQDVCFISRAAGRARFLGERIPLTPARIEDGGGTELGHVEAIELVTIGQRKGLELSGAAQRRYVTAVDRASSTVVVGTAEDLYTSTVELSGVVWSYPEARGGAEQTLTAQTSAHGRPHAVSLDEHGRAGGLLLRWDEPQRRVAPGQSVVVYSGERVLCGGLVD